MTSAPGHDSPIRVLELRSVRGPGGGPEKTILLGAATIDPARFKVTVCYIRDLRDREYRIDERAAGLGVDYVEVLERHSFDPGIWRDLRALVRARRIDIVHAHEHKTDLLAWLLARSDGIIPLATAHGWSGLSAKERFYYFFDRRLLSHYPMVVAVSESIRRTLIEHGADPACVRRIHNGIDPDAFKRNAPARDRIRSSLGLHPNAVAIGALGRLEAVKRFDLLIDAFARLPADLRGELVIAGEGTERSALEMQARERGVASRVHLIGQRDDIRDVHQALDVYVQSSDSEGIPNAILEAMSLETPIVATDVGGTREILDDGRHAVLVRQGDAAAIARAIEDVVRHPEATRARVHAARARIEHELSFAARMRALEQVYEELLTLHARPAWSAMAVA